MDDSSAQGVPSPDLLARIREAAGPVLLLGTSDTGKTSLASHLARAARAESLPVAVIDLDVGQSEIGPPGLVDVAEGEADLPLAQWRVRGAWYVGATSPFAAPLALVVGALRLKARAAELGLSTVLVDTPSFVNTPAGHSLAAALIDALRPALVLAPQLRNEMEPFLKGASVPVERLPVDPAVRSKPSALRTARRGARLAAYFEQAPQHVVRLADWTLRGTRLGFGQPLAPAECAAAASLLGCLVRHGERSASSVALWTVGPPRRDTARAAAELSTERLTTFDATAWDHRSLGFLAADGACLAMGVIEHLDWATLTATVRAPFYGLAETRAIAMGTMRHLQDGTSLPPVSERDA